MAACLSESMAGDGSGAAAPSPGSAPLDGGAVGEAALSLNSKMANDLDLDLDPDPSPARIAEAALSLVSKMAKECAANSPSHAAGLLLALEKVRGWDGIVDQRGEARWMMNSGAGYGRQLH